MMFITVVPEASTCRAYRRTVRVAVVFLLFAAARREWLGEVRANARRHPRVRFHNLDHADFVARLDLQARRHDFRIARITWRPGYLDVPDVTIVSTHYVQLAHDLPHVLDAVDPPPRSDHRAFEAIFLEAVDGRGVPFVAIYDSLRGHIMGGQWARSKRLFPYAHS
jgi:hypothetical protein